MARPINERLAEIDAQKNRLEQQKRKLLAQQSKQARNARIRRLIEVGTVVEKTIGIELDTPEKREMLYDFLTEEPNDESDFTYSYGFLLAKVMQESEKEIQQNT